MAAKYNNKSGSVKRLLKEAQEIAADPCPEFSAAPLEVRLQQEPRHRIHLPMLIEISERSL